AQRLRTRAARRRKSVVRIDILSAPCGAVAGWYGYNVRPPAGRCNGQALAGSLENLHDQPVSHSAECVEGHRDRCPARGPGSGGGGTRGDGGRGEPAPAAGRGAAGGGTVRPHPDRVEAAPGAGGGAAATE